MVITNEKVNYAFDLVKRILGENADGIYISKEEYEDGLVDNIYSDEDFDNIVDSIGQCDVIRGATKVVLMPVGCDFVIKLSITGIYSYNEDGDIEGITSRLKEGTTPLEIEEKIYRESSALKSILIPVFYIGDYNGIRVYIQEQYDFSQQDLRDYMDEDEIEQYEKDLKIAEKELATIESAESMYMPSSFMGSILKQFGRDFSDKIFKEIRAFNIEDLHCGNVVYINRKVGIADYAGYISYNNWRGA